MEADKFILTNKSGIELECRIYRPLPKDSSGELQDKTPLVLIAGGFGADVFTGPIHPPLTDWFVRRGYAVFRMNFRGNGNSEGDLAFATITAYLEDMQAALDHIKIFQWVESVGLCGVSYGGRLVLFEAAEHKSFDYKFMILLSPFLFLPEIDDKQHYEAIKNIVPKNSNEEFIDAFGHRVHYSVYLDLQNYNPWEVAENIKIPTLIVHGDCDEVCPCAQSVRIHGLIKTSELKTIPNLKHQYEDHFGEVLEVLDTWLNRNKKR